MSHLIKKPLSHVLSHSRVKSLLINPAHQSWNLLRKLFSSKEGKKIWRGGRPFWYAFINNNRTGGPPPPGLRLTVERGSEGACGRPSWLFRARRRTCGCPRCDGACHKCMSDDRMALSFPMAVFSLTNVTLLNQRSVYLGPTPPFA